MNINLKSIAQKTLVCIFLLTVINGATTAQQLSPDIIQKITDAAPETATATPKRDRRLLIFNLSLGYKHSAIEYASKAIEILGRKTSAFQVIQSDDMSIFSPANLNRFDAVLFNNTTHLKFEDPDLRQSLMKFVRSGKGIIGIHAASDNFYEWPEAAEMIGGQFDQHPWHSGGTWVIKIDDPTNPLCAAFQRDGFQINDEIYRMKAPYSRGKLRVLMSLNLQDERNLAVNGLRPTDVDVPISWVQRFGNGRVFYTVLGHNPHVYWDPSVLRHYLAGIQFALGDLNANADIPYEDFLAQISKYQFGEDRSSLTYFADYLREIGDHKDELKRVENQMADLLETEASFAGKQFICQQLSMMGSKESVSVLAEMLYDSTSSDIARYALERIEDKSAGKALEKALQKTTGKIKIGIINSIGGRGEGESAGRLGELIYDPDPAVALAVVSALGRIADKNGAKVLADALDRTEGALRVGIADAYLICADRFATEGRMSDATRIYERLHDPKESYAIRAAAFAGRVRTTQDKSAEIILDVLYSADSDLHPTASRLVNELESVEDIVKVSRALQDLSPDNQARLIAILSHKDHPVILEEVIKAAHHDNTTVRVAALKALARLGDETVVILLAQAAAEKGPVAETARSSLYSLRGKKVDQFILSSLNSTSSDVRAELIRSIGERRIYRAVEAMLAAAAIDTGRVRIEAIKVLRIIAKHDRMPAIAALFLNFVDKNELAELERTAVMVAETIPERNRRAESILDLLPSVSDLSVRVSMLHVLGRLGDFNALPVLRSGLKSDQPELVAAAIEALAQWPNSQPSDDLLNTARSAESEKHRIIALRGYVGLIRRSEDLRPEDAVSKLRTVIELAGETNEMKLVLSALSETRSHSALMLVSRYLKDDALRAEAEAATVRVAGDIIGSYPDISRTALERVVQSSHNQALIHQALNWLRTSHRFEDFLVGWQFAGPYPMEDGEVLDHVFAPESNSESVVWRIMPAGTDTSRPWVLDLGEAMGQINGAAYLRNRILSDSNRSVRLELGSDDGVKVWLNGEEVHKNNVNRSVSPASDVVQVDLREGWNHMMLKVVNAGGQWGACARIRTLSGDRVPGLKVNPVIEAGVN